MSPANLQKAESKEEAKGPNVLEKLRNLAFPDFSGATGGGANVRGGSPSAQAAKSRTEAPRQTAARGPGLQMTTEVRMGSNQRDMDLVLRPVFQTLPGGRPRRTCPASREGSKRNAACGISGWTHRGSANSVPGSAWDCKSARLCLASGRRRQAEPGGRAVPGRAWD